jgi:hypothetical protein
VTTYKLQFKYNLRLHIVNPQCLHVCLQYYLAITHSNPQFSEYRPVGCMQIKYELEIREITPPGIISFSISRKLLCGRRQRQEIFGATVDGD